MIEILPGNNVLIGGKSHSVHYHDGRYVIVQNTDDRPGGPVIGDSPNEPMPEQGPHNAGAMCRFKLFRIINNPGESESLGALIAEFTSLNQAMIRASKEP